jgi:predicted ester cyclase
MSMEANKDVARRAIEMWAGNAMIDTSLFRPDYLNWQEPIAAGGVGAISLEQWAEIVAANHLAFPHLKAEIDRQIAEGDSVATHWRFTATHQGDYEGLAGTGRRVSWTGVQIDRVQNGTLAESRVSWDKFTLFQTLGLIG